MKRKSKANIQNVQTLMSNIVKYENDIIRESLGSIFGVQCFLALLDDIIEGKAKPKTIIKNYSKIYLQTERNELIQKIIEHKEFIQTIFSDLIEIHDLLLETNDKEIRRRLKKQIRRRISKIRVETINNFSLKPDAFIAIEEAIENKITPIDRENYHAINEEAKEALKEKIKRETNTDFRRLKGTYSQIKNNQKLLNEAKANLFEIYQAQKWDEKKKNFKKEYFSQTTIFNSDLPVETYEHLSKDNNRNYKKYSAIDYRLETIQESITDSLLELFEEFDFNNSHSFDLFIKWHLKYKVFESLIQTDEILYNLPIEVLNDLKKIYKGLCFYIIINDKKPEIEAIHNETQVPKKQIELLLNILFNPLDYTDYEFEPEVTINLTELKKKFGKKRIVKSSIKKNPIPKNKAIKSLSALELMKKIKSSKKPNTSAQKNRSTISANQIQTLINNIVIQESQSDNIKRNPYISELAKRKANGYCQLCGEKAPFNDVNGNPYLETHHIEWLSEGGEDSIENTVALCPNCHRKQHILNLDTDTEILKKKAISNFDN